MTDIVKQVYIMKITTIILKMFYIDIQIEKKNKMFLDILLKTYRKFLNSMKEIILTMIQKDFLY